MNTNRLAILGTIVGLSVSAQARQGIDFSTPAEPVSKVLASLSAIAHLDLKVSDSVAGDVLLIRAKGIPASELMDRIAKTLTAEWVKEGDTYKLSRTAALERQLQNEELIYRTERVKAGLAKLAPPNDATWDEAYAAKYVKAIVDKTDKAFAESPAKGQGTEVYGDTSMNNPSARALMGILSHIDPHVLAAITPSKRLVFSTAPTPVQVPFPSNLTAVVDRFAREQKFFSEAIKDAEEKSDSPNKEAIFHMDGLATGAPGEGDPRLGVGRAILVATGLGDEIMFNLTFLDPNGNKIGGGFHNVSLPKITQANPAISNPEPIVFSETTLSLAKLINAPNARHGAFASYVSSKNDAGQETVVALTNCPDGSGWPKPSAAMRNLILHPELEEPMSFAPTEEIDAAADSQKENVVAWLPDLEFVPMTQAVSPKLTVGGFLTKCSRDWGLKVVQQDGWITMTPREPGLTEFTRIDRKACGELLRKLDKTGYLTLADISAYARTRPSQPSTLEFDERYLELINPAAAYRLPSYGDWRMLRFYDSLSEPQRGSLATNSQVALMDLSQVQVGLLTDMVYNSFDGPLVGPPDDPHASDFFYTITHPQSGERTDLLPRGVVTDGFCRIGKRTEPAIFAENTNSGASLFMTADENASQRVLSETSDPWVSRIAGRPSTFDRFQPSTATSLDFTFIFAKDLSLHRSLHDADVVAGSQPGSYDSISSDFRKQVEQKQSSLSQALKNWTSQARNGSKVPPPYGREPMRSKSKRT